MGRKGTSFVSYDVYKTSRGQPRPTTRPANITRDKKEPPFKAAYVILFNKCPKCASFRFPCRGSTFRVFFLVFSPVWKQQCSVRFTRSKTCAL